MFGAIVALGTPAALGAVCEHPLRWGGHRAPTPVLAGRGEGRSAAPGPPTPWLSPQAQRHVNDLYEDLRDGHNLISLLEVLSGDTLVGATPPCLHCPPAPPRAGTLPPAVLTLVFILVLTLAACLCSLSSCLAVGLSR